MALELVRVLSKGSPISNRLWNTIRHLKEVAPKLGLTAGKENTSTHPTPTPLTHSQPQQLPTPQSQPQSQSQQSQPQAKSDSDPSRSAAMAMAGLAGVNVNANEVRWTTEHSSSPEGMAHDLTSLFEAAGGLQAMGNGNGNGIGMGAQVGVQDLVQQPQVEGPAPEVDVALTGMLDDLF